MYKVYVLRSLKDSNLYIGHTKDLDKRICEHNKGKVRSTKSRRPFKLIYFENISTKSEAYQREMFLKSGQGRLLLKKILHNLSED